MARRTFCSSERDKDILSSLLFSSMAHLRHSRLNCVHQAITLVYKSLQMVFFGGVFSFFLCDVLYPGFMVGHHPFHIADVQGRLGEVQIPCRCWLDQNRSLRSEKGLFSCWCRQKTGSKNEESDHVNSFLKGRNCHVEGLQQLTLPESRPCLLSLTLTVEQTWSNFSFPVSCILHVLVSSVLKRNPRSEDDPKLFMRDQMQYV